MLNKNLKDWNTAFQIDMQIMHLAHILIQIKSN